MIALRTVRRVTPVQLIAHTVLALLSLACLLPLWLIVSASFTDDRALARSGFRLWPQDWSLTAYQYILTDPDQLLRSYLVTSVVTVVGVTLGVLMTAGLAWPLARKDFALSRPLSFFVFFTMLFNGGLVPYYLLVTRYLQIGNSILALLVPFLVVPFYVLILRTYFAQIPQDLLDAAAIDGAGEVRMFFSIVLPISRPALATIGLLLALLYWNDWQTALYFIRDPQLYPLQYLLYAILENARVLAARPTSVSTPVSSIPLQMAMAVLATGPAALAFLFFQKHLVRGISIGAIK
ncbi:MAG: carbohydrate ABC transporter permease [Chloroflexi bacterium OHK40]